MGGGPPGHGDGGGGSCAASDAESGKQGGSGYLGLFSPAPRVLEGAGGECVARGRGCGEVGLGGGQGRGIPACRVRNAMGIVLRVDPPSQRERLGAWRLDTPGKGVVGE
ncbi:hypothetical protein NDU88_002748 [Pleurodeles waltl]|uniref:Uncharacterized protein n=1 Tax=Pleurodeles waltl TaxID=8319 RepID=A0AAV7TM24_PLEWA|nr:hypothetical protein NDU88_002748 [Pleurodeles waltl]